MTFSDKAAITGVGETDFVKGTERTAVDMMLEASRRAIADAGLRPSDIDGMVPPPIYTTSEELAANLGIDVLRYAATVHMGGASPTTALQHAAIAIAAGLCDHVLVTLGWNGFSALRPKPGAPPTRPMNMNTLTNTIRGYYMPFGVFLPVQMYAWLATRHSQLHGVGPEAMGAVAMACRRHAQLNPKAFTYGRPLDWETYHDARMVSEPFRLYDCCLETDGALACVVTSIERARDLRQKPVLVHAVAQASGPNPVHLANYNNTPEMVTTAVFCAEQLWARSEIGPRDIDCAQIYDAFTPLVISGLEDYGFCKRGEGGPFTEGGRLELGGELPTLTSGGGLSEAYVHGFNLILEAVRQVRGTSTAQVEDCRNVLVTGASGVATSAMVVRGE